DYVGAMHHHARGVRVRPGPVKVHRRGLDPLGLRLLFERRGGLDAVEDLWFVIQVAKEEATISATDIQQRPRPQRGHLLPAPIIAPLTAPLVSRAHPALQEPHDHGPASDNAFTGLTGRRMAGKVGSRQYAVELESSSLVL